MIVLIILLIIFVLLFIPQFFGKQWFSNRRKGQVAMGIMLLFTGIAHFFRYDEMLSMLPPWVPFRSAIIYLTGMMELVFAAGFVLYKSIRLVSSICIVFLLMVLPANIYAALQNNSVGDGFTGATYLWFRVPLQVFIIGWTAYFGLKLFKNKPLWKS